MSDEAKKGADLDAEVARLHKSVDDLSRDVQSHSRHLIKHEQQDLKIEHDVSFIKRHVEEIRTDLKDLAHIIRGNGNPGLVSRLAVLEEVKKTRVSSWAQSVTLIAALLALFGTIAAAFITKI